MQTDDVFWCDKGEGEFAMCVYVWREGILGNVVRAPWFLWLNFMACDVGGVVLGAGMLRSP